MGPVHKPAEVIPFVHSPNLDAVSQSNRDAFCEIDIVCDEQRLSTSNIKDETLVARAVIIVRQQSRNDTADIDPASGVTFAEALAQAVPMFIVVIVPGGRASQSAIKNAASHPWPPRF